MAIPVPHSFLKICQRRRVLRRDPQGKIVKEVQMHEMVLVPVAEPDHLYALFGAEPDEPLPAGARELGPARLAGDPCGEN